jgi:hypothetical protein
MVEPPDAGAPVVVDAPAAALVAPPGALTGPEPTATIGDAAAELAAPELVNALLELLEAGLAEAESPPPPPPQPARLDSIIRLNNFSPLLVAFFMLTPFSFQLITKN